MTPTTSFILITPLFAAVWALGNSYIHNNYLYLEHAKVAKYLEEIGETQKIKKNKRLAHAYWFLAMGAISGLLLFLFDSDNEKIGAALYCAASFWGVFGWTAKWILNGTPFYLGSNWIDERFKFKGGLVVMTLLQIACGVVGVYLLN